MSEVCETCGSAIGCIPLLLYARPVVPPRDRGDASVLARRSDDWKRELNARDVVRDAHEVLLFAFVEPTRLPDVVLRSLVNDADHQVFMFMDLNDAPFASLSDAMFRARDWFTAERAQDIAQRWLTFVHAVTGRLVTRDGLYLDRQSSVLFRVRRSAVAGRLTVRLADSIASLVRLDRAATDAFARPSEPPARLAFEEGDDGPRGHPAGSNDDVEAFLRHDFVPFPDAGSSAEHPPDVLLPRQGQSMDAKIAPEETARPLGRSVLSASPWRHQRAPEAIVPLSAYESAGATRRGTEPVPPLPPTGTAKHYLEAVFPDHVGARREMTVSCQAVRTVHVTNVGLPFDVPIAPTDVRLILDAPDFEFLSDSNVIVQVEPGRDSKVVDFRLRAPATGEHRLFLRAYIGGFPIGGIDFTILVSPARAQTIRQQSDPAIWRQRTPGEITIDLNVRQTPQGYRYCFRWIDGTLGGPPEFVRESATPPDAFRVTAMRTVSEVADGVTHSRWVRRKLQGAGATLWNDLLPDGLRALILSTQRLQCLMFTTNVPAIPFELLHPGGDASDRGFLVENVAVTRWSQKPTPVPSTIRVDIAHLIAPPGASQSALDELNSVEEALRGRLDVQERLSTIDDVMTTIDRGIVGVVHFACHDTFVQSKIRFGASTYDGDAFAGGIALPNALFFVNASRTVGTESTNLDGWATSAIARRCGAFIAPQWCSRPSSAIMLARTFYREIATGQPIASAIAAARMAVKETTGDPSWLAYAVYGDPQATL